MKHLTLIALFSVCSFTCYALPNWQACPHSPLTDAQCETTCGQLVAPPQCKDVADECGGNATCFHADVPRWPTVTLASRKANFVNGLSNIAHRYDTLFNQDWYKTEKGKAYLQQVYGSDYKDIDPTQITYFYQQFPFRSAMGISFPQAAYYIEGVPMDRLWIPAFWPTQKDRPWITPDTRAVLNLYDPHAGRWNDALTPLKGRVEIAHMTGDDIGWWAYYAPGSGIYMPLGKTIAVLNKLDYLVRVMQYSYKDIARLPGWDVPDIANPNGNPNGIVFRHWQYMRNLLLGVTIHDTSDPNRMLTVNHQTSLADLLSFATVGDNYLLNKFAMGTHNINKIIYDDAKKRGFDSVQFLSQPNPNGGWMAELFFIVDSSKPGVVRTLESRLQLHDHSSCDVEYLPTYPGFGRNSAGLLTCRNLPISQGKS